MRAGKTQMQHSPVISLLSHEKERPVRLLRADIGAIFAQTLQREPTEAEYYRLERGAFLDVYNTVLRLWKRTADHAMQPPDAPAVVPVMMLFRDNEEYCRRCLPHVMRTVSNAVNLMGWQVRFYFYENNSVDQTVALLHATAASFPVVLRSDVLPTPPASECSGERTTTRCNRMAMCRNAVMAMALPDLVRSPVALLLDTNVFASADAIIDVVNAVMENPRIGMATACTKDARNVMHYYDTFAYMCTEDADPDVSVHRYQCMLSTCTECAARRRPHVRLFHPAQSGLFEVASAFGGLAALRTSAMLLSEWYSANNMCEHIEFCRRIRHSGFRIVLVPSAHAEWLCDFSLFRQYDYIARRVMGLVHLRPDRDRARKIRTWSVLKAAPTRDDGSLDPIGARLGRGRTDSGQAGGRGRHDNPRTAHGPVCVAKRRVRVA